MAIINDIMCINELDYKNNEIINTISVYLRSLAMSINASAILVIGLNELKIKKIKKIPVIYVSSYMDIIYEKMKFINSNDDQFDKSKLANFESRNHFFLNHIIPIEYLLRNINEGIIICISKIENSVSILLHNVCENKIICKFKKIHDRLNENLISKLLELSLFISMTGREGKKIGTAFVIGDTDNVLARSHQMIINPYKSQEKKDRDILNKENWESIINFAQLDGVFIISKEGEIISAGRYLDVDASKLKIGRGLGSRHISAATITRDTNAVAIIISESGGTIRIYMDGKEVFCINPYLASTVSRK